MPNFVYTAKDETGKTIKGTMASSSRENLIEGLQQQNYYILSVEEIIIEAPSERQKTKPVKITKKFSRKKSTTQDKLSLSYQLATMLESGVNLLRSLTICVNQAESRQFHDVLVRVRDDVEQGSSFSSALAKHPKIFDVLWVSLIEVGEASGTMPKVLRKIASYAEKAEQTKSAIISALIYPGILMTVAMSAIAVFALFIGPKFQTMYDSMNADLPALTDKLLKLFSFIRSNFFIISGIIIAVILILRNYFKTTTGRIHLEKILFKLPVVNNMITIAIIEKFASQMAILIESGVPILYALDIIERLIGNRVCEQHIIHIKANVREGKMVSAEMAKTGFFPSMATQMVAVGEETGELSKMFIHVAEYYQRLLSVAISRFTSMFEPLILVVMGGVIGVIVVAMFLPILNISKMATQGGG